MLTRILRPFMVLALALPLGSCAAAALAGAGAATGIYLTTRGAQGVIEGSVADVDRRTGLVLAEQNITITDRDVSRGGEKIEIKGKTADGKDVRIEMNRKSATTTEVDVEVRESPVVWDQDRARDILQRIVTIR